MDRRDDAMRKPMSKHFISILAVIKISNSTNKNESNNNNNSNDNNNNNVQQLSDVTVDRNENADAATGGNDVGRRRERKRKPF